MIVPAMAGLLIALMLVTGIVFFRESIKVLQTVKIVDFEPMRIGENYRCPTCRAFWYMKDEEVHFKGCIVPIVRRLSTNATSERLESSK